MSQRTKKGTFAKVYPFYKKHFPVFYLTIAIIVVHALASTLIPQVQQLVIDRVINPALGKDPVYSDSNVFSFLLGYVSGDNYLAMLNLLVPILIGLCLIKYITHYARWNMAHASLMMGENATRDFAYRKMLRHSTTLLNRYTSGDLLNVTNNDPTAIKDMYLHYLPELINAVLYMVFAIYFLLVMNPLLTIVPLVIGLITILIVRRYNKILRIKYDKIRQGNVELNTYIQENINGVRIVRAFATEKDEMTRFEKRNAQFRDNYVDLARVTSKYSMIFTILGESIGILSVILGIILATSGHMSVGEFATFTSYCFTINGNMIAIAGNVGNIQNCVVCANRYFEFADRPDSVAEPAEPVPAPQKPLISFRNVSMCFDEGQYAVKNINLDIEYGKRVGIMGKTGSGKSVLFKLLTRLYDCTQGEILLNGVNIKDIKSDEVRREFSYVMQDVFLFSDTVRNNIAYYDESAPEERIRECADDACVTQFVDKLSDGFDTIVGEKGLGLSGGQKQRVSIARALLKNAPIILLDDCTSALDYETEKEITENLYRHYGDRTMLISSHRAGSVAHCDEILYMEDGEIVERGSHEELMALGGRYCAIFTEQESLRMEEFD